MKLINVMVLLSLLVVWGCNDDDDETTTITSLCDQLEKANGSFASQDLGDFSASCAGNGVVTIAYSADDGEDTSLTCSDGKSINASGISGSTIVMDLSNTTISGSDISGTASVDVDLGATVNGSDVVCSMDMTMEMSGESEPSGMDTLSCTVDGSTVTLGPTFDASDCTNQSSDFNAIAQYLVFFDYLASMGDYE